MSDNFNNNLKQLGDILGNENISENLVNILSMLANSTKKEKPPENTQNRDSSQDSQDNQYRQNRDSSQNRHNTQKDGLKEEIYNNVELMRKVKNIMNDAKTLDDPRINLLTAIRPFLNNNRQKKVGDCIKLFQIVHVSDMMTDFEKSM